MRAYFPHVIQGWEQYKNGLIFYSLGNFIWDSCNINFSLNLAYVVNMSFSVRGISYDVISIVYRNNKLDIEKDVGFLNYLNELNWKIQNYASCIEDINQRCREETNRYMNTLNEMVRLRPNNRLRNRLLNSIKIILGILKVDNKRLYLCVSNETL